MPSSGTRPGPLGDLPSANDHVSPAPGSGGYEDIEARIHDYQACCHHLQNFENAEKDLERIDEQLSKLALEMSCNSSTIETCRRHEMRLKRQIHRNENPRLFHYLVFNRSKKITYLKNRIAEVRDEEAMTSTRLAMQKSEMKQLSDKRRKFQRVVVDKKQLEAQRQRAFNDSWCLKMFAAPTA